MDLIKLDEFRENSDKIVCVCVCVCICLYIYVWLLQLKRERPVGEEERTFGMI